MQTIKVTIKKATNGIVFSIDSETIATAWEQGGTKYSEMKRVLHPHGCRQEMHLTLSDAVEFVSDAIVNHFASLGLGVKFVNA